MEEVGRMPLQSQRHRAIRCNSSPGQGAWVRCFRCYPFRACPEPSRRAGATEGDLSTVYSSCIMQQITGLFMLMCLGIQCNSQQNMRIFLAGWEATFNGDEQCRRLINTQAVDEQTAMT